MVLKIREGGTVQRRALYLALGVTLDGERDVLGMWFQETEGAKFWMQVLTDLKQRGVRDILIACVDGLAGFPEAIEAIFPKTTVQTCIVHLIRNSLKYVPRREREQVARDLKPIYTAKDADQAHAELEAFDREVGRPVPGHHPGVAERVGARGPVPRVPRRGPPRDLHHECHRSPEPAAAQGEPRPRAASRTTTPPASSSTSRCRTRPRNGHDVRTGRPRCSRSRSTSVTASPTMQTDSH